MKRCAVCCTQRIATKPYAQRIGIGATRCALHNCDLLRRRESVADVIKKQVNEMCQSFMDKSVMIKCVQLHLNGREIITSKWKHCDDADSDWQHRFEVSRRYLELNLSNKCFGLVIQ